MRRNIFTVDPIKITQMLFFVFGYVFSKYAMVK